MGLFRLVYKIGRMVFRDFLFKVPKKYLVVIIIFLTLFILKSSVFAAFVPSEFSETLVDNVKNMSEYQSGDYFCFVGHASSTVIRVCYLNKVADQKFYFVETQGGTNYSFDSNKTMNLYKVYLTNVNGSSFTDVTGTGNGVLDFYYRGMFPAFFSNTDIYTNNSYSDLWYTAPVSFRPPTILNMDSELESWSFDNLVISAGDLKSTNNNLSNKFYLQIYYNDKFSTIDLFSYMTIENDYITFNIPRSVLLQNSAIINGLSVRFVLNYEEASEEVFGTIYYTRTDYDLGTYTFNLSQTEQDNINEDKTQQSLDNIANAQQQTTNAINTTNNFLQDTSVNDTNISINSPTIANSDSVTTIDNNITSIFNSFINILSNSSGHYEINIPLPNFNNGGQYSFVTFNSGITQNVLNGTNIPGFNFNCYTLVQLFWWFVLGGYLIRLLYRIATFIYEGKIFTPSSIVSDIANEYGKITGAFI